MPKKDRLTHTDFCLTGRPRCFHGKLFSLSVSLLPASARGQSAMGGKFACVVSKKVALKAHDRNRIKRHCREAMHPLMKDVAAPLALVAQAKKQAVGASFADIREDIKSLLRLALSKCSSFPAE